MAHAIENKDAAPEIARTPLGDLVFVVGSGVSHEPPSLLPTGQQLRRGLLETLLAHGDAILSPDERARLRIAICGSSSSDETLSVHGIPFEAALDVHRQLFPDSRAIMDFLLDNLSHAQPNAIHELLATFLLAQKDAGATVVTLNYDELIEDAPVNGAVRSFRVATDGEYKAWAAEGHRSLLLKLHGSFHVPDTVVATLSTEHGLDPWKRELLRKRLAGKVVVLIGYSGYDFDVCPLLLESRPRFVYWNTPEPSEDPSPDGQGLIERGGQHVHGGLPDLLEPLKAALALVHPAAPRSEPATQDRVPFSIDEEGAHRWLIRLTVEAGLGQTALRLISGTRGKWPHLVRDLGLCRDEARAHFLVAHTPEELRASRIAYRLALNAANGRIERADLWLNYHEPCRLELRATRNAFKWALAVGGMLRALLSVWILALGQRGHGWSRIRGYWRLRLAQNLELFTRLILRPSRIASRWGRSATDHMLRKASRYFEEDDNYLGSLQTQRIRLRVSSAPVPEQLEATFRMKDYYRRLGYLTGWSNSNRDAVEVMAKDGAFDVARARALITEALEVSRLAGDRPGMAKAAATLSELPKA